MLDLWDDQAHHRMDLESRVTTSDIVRSWAGLIAGTIVSLAVVIAGGIVGVYGEPRAGATIITGTVISLAGVFVYGSTNRRAERDRKAGKFAGKK